MHLRLAPLYDALELRSVAALSASRLGLLGVVLGVAAAALPSCTVVRCGRPAPHPLVTGLWKFHGGPQAWQKHAAVRFAYTVRPAHAQAVTFSDVAFRLDDFSKLWLKKAPSSTPTPIRLEVPPGAVVAQLKAAGWQLPESAETRSAVDFALRSIRLLLELPLTTVSGPWEYRTLLAPPEAGTTREQLEVVFRHPFSPLGPCFLHCSSGGRLERATYLARHPFVPPHPATVSFDDYEQVSGVAFAKRRRHHALLPSALYDPFADAAEIRQGVFLLEEVVSAVAFLDAHEAAAALPEAAPGERTTATLDVTSALLYPR